MNRLLYVLGLSLLLLFGCTNSPSAQDSGTSMDMAYATTSKSLPDSMSRNSGPSTSSNLESKIQTNGSLSIEVNNLSSSIKKIEELITIFQGSIISSNSSKSNKPYTNINIRIPSSSFNEFLIAVKDEASSVISENIYTKDVTTEYIDITANLNVMKQTEHRFLSLLLDTKKVEEIIQVEKELMRIRADIDSLQGRKSYLDKTTTNSELNLSILENTPTSGNDWSFNRSLNNALGGLISFTKYAADLLINIVIFSPVVMGLLLLMFLPYKFYKKRKR